MVVGLPKLPEDEEPAPWFRIPKQNVISVEHPCVVKNADKAIETLGGDANISAYLKEDNRDIPIGLKLRPDDPFSQTILSSHQRTENILLQVTVPKRTGRKRKRGTDVPFIQDSTDSGTKKSARYLLQSLRDNANTYQVEPVASIPFVHAFRAMPDFVYSSSQGRFLNQFREKILARKYPALSEFQMGKTSGLEDTEMIPPAAWSTTQFPHNYAYRQNPAVRAFVDPSTGKRRLYNTQEPIKIRTFQAQHDTPHDEIPTAPHPNSNPLENEAQHFRDLVDCLKATFARRPIWTRRGLANQLPPNAAILLTKFAMGYVAYAIRSGPWRDTYVALGVDPRTDPKYRKFQTLTLHYTLDNPHRAKTKQEECARKNWKHEDDKRSHIFGGEGWTKREGNVWQLCDLEDEDLKKLVDMPMLNIRERCEPRYFGWYLNGTWCKLKIILKIKMDILQNKFIPEDDIEQKLERLMRLPDDFDLSAKSSGGSQQLADAPFVAAPLAGFLPFDASRMELEWAAIYRALCRAPYGKIPASGRLSKSKPTARASYVGALEGETQGNDLAFRGDSMEDEALNSTSGLDVAQTWESLARQLGSQEMEEVELEHEDEDGELEVDDAEEDEPADDEEDEPNEQDDPEGQEEQEDNKEN